MNVKNIIILCCIVGFLGRLTGSLAYAGGWRPDEIFQNLEPAHRLITGHGVVTWEWHAGIRNWVLPGIIVGIWDVTRLLGLGTPIVAVKLVFSLLSVSIIATFAALGGMRYGRVGALTCGLIAALWPDLLIGAERTAGEFQAGNTLALAIGLAMIGRQLCMQGYDSLKPYLACALLVGISAVFRFQLAPACGVVMLWLLFWIRKWSDRLLVLAASALPIIVLGVVDWITLGGFYASIINNFYVNIVKSVAQSYGVMPFYYYFGEILSYWRVVFPFVVYFFIKGLKDALMPATIAALIIFYHSLIAHKEISFIYAAMPLIVLVASLGLSSVLVTLRWQAMAGAMVVMASFCLMAGYPFTHHMNMASHMATLVHLASERKDACGIAIMAGPYEWGDAGGYSQFTKRDIPLYFYYDRSDLQGNEGHYNYVVSSRNYRLIAQPLGGIKCQGPFCLFRTAATCTSPSDYNQFEKTIYKVEALKAEERKFWSLLP
ncbi:glycosyltransferase family protein [Komagataeibacter saccharivorans]|uniref:Alg9-like mannosyltransferase family protein n=1 Tax=Komagataeibacter saccharivorans TaxID=265959 RepID=A0A347WAE9_9PROT|nr:hypothetical protein [Komagataeibacter saccharivorans]AXY21842.1 Alg9-like mannosyltransferase family protein [Komagataeibacter saccharivorans]